MKPKTDFWLDLLVCVFVPALCVTMLVGCWPFSPAVVIPSAGSGQANPVKPPAAPGTVEQLEKELAQARKDKAEAEGRIKQKERELADARIDADQKKLRWLCGICVLTLLGCIAGCIFLPGAAKWFVSGAIASAAVGATCLLIAAILPWMPWILAGLAVVGVGVAIYLWRRDHAGLRKVVEGFEAVKGELPGYREKMKKFVNGTTDLYVDSVREELGLKPKEE